jgi:sugar lactone lactonase YvrE
MMKKYLFLFFCFCAGYTMNAQTITTIAGDGTYGFFGDGGPATGAKFQYAWYVALGSAGSVYFTDNANHRIRKVDAAGVISTFAGNGSPVYAGDGGQATAASFNGASGITVDGAGNVYFADISDRRIRKINTAGIISTIAGTGTAGYSGDGGAATAAQVSSPYGVLADAAGNIYIADAGNNRVRKISATGIISTVAGDGTPSFGGDGGPATAAQLSSPVCLALDVQGNLYIADGLNNRIRKVSTSGIITTVAGTGTAGYSGDGGAATAADINQPLGVATDAAGNVFISDQFNHRIRRVDPAGIITTIAGTGTGAYSGDGGPATVANIKQSFGIIADSTGDIYFSDWGNYRIRRLSYNNRIPAFVSGAVDSTAICENDMADISALLDVYDADAAQTLTWGLFSGAAHGTALVSYSAASTAGTVVPTGITYTPSPGYSGMDSFTVRVDDGHSIDTIKVYVRVKPLPAIAPITGTAVVCIGVPATMSNAVTGGVWHMANPLATIDAAGVVSGVGQGADTVYYTTTLAGCNSLVSHPVDIYVTSVSIAGPPAICFDYVVTYGGIPGGGTWTSANGITTVSSTGDVYGVTPGVDTITYSLTNPCGTFTFQKEVRVNAMIAPVVVISATPSPFIYPGTNVTLNANIVSGAGIAYSYQWQLNGLDIPGATDSFYISSTFANNDSVTCMVTNGPCAASSFGWIYIVHLNDHDAGVHDPLSAMVYLSPNPNRGAFRIEAYVSATASMAEIEVSDMIGRVVYKQETPVVQGVLKKDIELGNDLPDGVYILRLAAGETTKVMHVVMTR